jgi:hypothetical protein
MDIKKTQSKISMLQTNDLDVLYQKDLGVIILKNKKR